MQVEGYCNWQLREGFLDSVERGDALEAEALLNRHLDYLEKLLLNAGPVLSQNRVAD